MEKISLDQLPEVLPASIGIAVRLVRPSLERIQNCLLFSLFEVNFVNLPGFRGSDRHSPQIICLVRSKPIAQLLAHQSESEIVEVVLIQEEFFHQLCKRLLEGQSWEEATSLPTELAPDQVRRIASQDGFRQRRILQ